MPGSHRAYVSDRGRGSFTYVCSCGHQGGNYGRRPRAEEAAKRHEANPNRQPHIRVTAR